MSSGEGVGDSSERRVSVRHTVEDIALTRIQQQTSCERVLSDLDGIWCERVVRKHIPLWPFARSTPGDFGPLNCGKRTELIVGMTKKAQLSSAASFNLTNGLTAGFGAAESAGSVRLCLLWVRGTRETHLHPCVYP